LRRIAEVTSFCSRYAELAESIHTRPYFPDASLATLFPIMSHKTVPGSIVCSDGWRGYTVLDVSDFHHFHHFQINHSESFADKQNHISGIDNFWNQAKRNMRKFNGVPKAHLALFSKECEWRFNNSDP
jgi:transposase